MIKESFFTTFNKLVLPKQSLFGLPWLGISLITVSTFPSWSLIRYIGAAFFSARIVGMCFNRLLDHAIDAENPRTQGRPLPQGEITRSSVHLIGWGALLLFFYCIMQTNMLSIMLSPVIACLLIGYSYMKRFSAACHFVLGLIHFFSPLLAWSIVHRELSLAAFSISAAAGFLITASDIIYACQDYAFDSRKGLHSIPVSIGIERALLLAKWLHGACIVSLLIFGYSFGLSWVYFLGIVLISAICTICYRTDNPFEVKFHILNTTTGFIVALSIIGDLLWRAL